MTLPEANNENQERRQLEEEQENSTNKKHKSSQKALITSKQLEDIIETTATATADATILRLQPRIDAMERALERVQANEQNQPTVRPTPLIALPHQTPLEALTDILRQVLANRHNTNR